MIRRLLVATQNQGKVAEFAEMLADLDIEWHSLADVGETRDVEETGHTFYENAVLKAEAYAKATGMLTLADDSGLEVDALDGAPGLYTARYAGPGASDAGRWKKLLQALRDTPEGQRGARFRCAVALVNPGQEQAETAEGTCEGWIAFAPAGIGGFGYDPVFYVPEYGCTLAELPREIKNQISHRARAVQAARPLLVALLASAQ